MDKMKKVVVVAPTYNEQGSIGKAVELILAQNGKVDGFEVHVLVVDSHSPDGTGEIAQKLAKENSKVHFLDITERGLGRAIIQGYKYALEELKADVLMQIDADLQHDPNDIPKFLVKINDGFEFVQGSRYAKGGANKISLARQFFSFGMSLTCRILTGIWKISDFAPSFKAFTKEAYKRMDKNSIPWQGTTFIIQMALVVEAARANAKMTEVPIIFRERNVDRSKNEIANYIIDVLGYGIEVRLAKWGIKVPVLYLARRSKTLLKFGTVGFFGTMIDLIFYNLFISYFGIQPATSRGISMEIAILNNFTFNHIWTFKKRKTKSTVWQKLLIFNFVSLGGLAIGVLVVKFFHLIYGDGAIDLGFMDIQYYNIYFFLSIPPTMTWNFLMNHYFTWKNED
jgi:dolichol-phosphate mannosyltransferase